MFLFTAAAYRDVPKKVALHTTQSSQFAQTQACVLADDVRNCCAFCENAGSDAIRENGGLCGPVGADESVSGCRRGESVSSAVERVRGMRQGSGNGGVFVADMCRMQGCRTRFQ